MDINKLKPFTEIEKYVKLAKQGIPFSVILNVEDFYQHGEGSHADNYLNMLGFDKKDKYKYCTILGELHNMPHHYVVLGNKNMYVSGIHGDIFYIDMEEEAELNMFEVE